MYSLTKSFHLSASHCLKGHPKCGRMHGHNYQIEVTIGTNNLNESGMVIDFGDLNTILDKVLGQYDHMHLGTVPDGWQANPEHVISLPFKQTTAENLAKYWGEEIVSHIHPLSLIEINIFESPRSKASWRPEER